MATSMMKEKSVALPKTYAQPIRPVSGTGCVKIGPNNFEVPVRSSNARHARVRMFIRPLGKFAGSGFAVRGREPSGFVPRTPNLELRTRSRNRYRARLDLHLPVVDAHRICCERLGWRPGGDRAILVVDAAVTGAHEEVRVRQPAHRAAEMRAVDREGDEIAARPRAGATPPCCRRPPSRPPTRGPCTSPDSSCRP